MQFPLTSNEVLRKLPFACDCISLEAYQLPMLNLHFIFRTDSLFLFSKPEIANILLRARSDCWVVFGPRAN